MMEIRKQGRNESGKERNKDVTRNEGIKEEWMEETMSRRIEGR